MSRITYFLWLYRWHRKYYEPFSAVRIAWHEAMKPTPF